MKFVMTVTALCAAVLIGTGAVMGAADIRAAESSSQPDYSSAVIAPTEPANQSPYLAYNKLDEPVLELAVDESYTYSVKIETVNGATIRKERLSSWRSAQETPYIIEGILEYPVSDTSCTYKIKVIGKTPGTYDIPISLFRISYLDPNGNSVTEDLKLGTLQLTVTGTAEPTSSSAVDSYSSGTDSYSSGTDSYSSDTDSYSSGTDSDIPKVYSGTCGENLTWQFDEPTKTLTISGTGDMAEDAGFSQMPWRSIKADIQTVILEEGVTSVCSFAFDCLPSLERFESRGGLESIYCAAFDGCSKLTSVEFGDSLKTIDVTAFLNCSSLQEITIPETVTTIGLDAFCKCKELAVITILNPECEIADGLSSVGDTICNERGKYTGVIRGYTGSTAQAFAEKCGYTFEALDQKPTEPETEPTEPATEPTEPERSLGDLNGDTTVNASDAANVLIASAAAGAGGELGLTEAQIKAADVNTDTTVNASDAAIILIYSAAVGAGQENVQITDFVHK